MCGILGVASFNRIKNREWLRPALDKMTHRGPDSFGIWWSKLGNVGFGHRRLSIIDLSSSGHQPMTFNDLGITIVFNGEIYNFRELRDILQKKGFNFKSNSDTEVIAYSYIFWGEDCLNHFNGAFAFAIYNENNNEIFLARDRVGEKPLFYHLQNGTIYFASELKSLIDLDFHNRKVNLNSLDCYLHRGFVPGKYCILDGFNKLEAAHALKLNLASGNHKIWRYWSLPNFDDSNLTNCIDENQILFELENLLEDAVAKQLTADVPVGVLLSGGLDSSLITAMASRHTKKVKTFCIGFSGFNKHDETEHARLISRYFNTDHIQLNANPDIAIHIPSIIRQFDEPIVDSSMIPTWLVSNLVSEHCSVALGGDGGDELFGGYATYSRLLWMQKNLSIIPKSLKNILASFSNNYLPVGFKGKNYFSTLDINLNNDLPTFAIYFDNNIRKKLLKSLKNYEFTSEEIFKSRLINDYDLLGRATKMDFTNYLTEDILVKVDRASMMNSLEVRAPFLDFRIIEFAFGKIPSNLKANSQQRKIILKKVAKKILPPNFDYIRKQGFSIPMDDWLKSGPFRDLFWSVLTDPKCSFDRNTINDLLKNQDKGYNNGERLFALVQFELWKNEYNITLN
jgi:asparagine synthase (glutamine-hydrolysing)